MSKDSGGPAFPMPAYQDHHGNYEGGNEGMTLRDWIAAQSLMIAKEWEESFPTHSSDGRPTYQGIAERAYRMADAMLAERNKP